MKWRTILRRKPAGPRPELKGALVTVDNTYAEIRAAMAAKKINYAYGFGLILEKNKRAELARNSSS